MGQVLNLPEKAALAYLRERGGSIFVNEPPAQTVKGLFGRPIAGLEVYQALCQKGIARINTQRDRGDAWFGDTIEVLSWPHGVPQQGHPQRADE